MNPLDLFDLRSALTEDEQLVQDSVARLVDARVLPLIQECFEHHRFPARAGAGTGGARACWARPWKATAARA